MLPLFCIAWRCYKISCMWNGYFHQSFFCPPRCRRGSELDYGSEIRVRFPAYPHRLWSLWWQGGKRCLWKSPCPCRGRLGTLKTPSCPWHWVSGSRSKFGNWTTVPLLYSWNIAECDVKPQPTNQNCPLYEQFVNSVTGCDTFPQNTEVGVWFPWLFILP